jgi:hypothetical protein
MTLTVMTVPLLVTVHRFAKHSPHIQAEFTLKLQFLGFVYVVVIRDLRSSVNKVLFLYVK